MLELNIRLLNMASRNGPISLVYHSISESPNTPQWPWEVSLKRFEEQLDILKDAGWKSYCIRELKNPELLSDKAVFITFDDGYENNFMAVKALYDRGMRATWFIVYDDIGKHSSWNDAGASAKPMLSEQQLKKMDSMGMEIGSHGMSHCRLAEIGNDKARQEITLSKRKLEKIVGKEIECFCYPYGSHNNSVVGSVRKANYRFACTTKNGWVFFHPDPLRIRRVAIYSKDTIVKFVIKIYLMSSHLNTNAIIKSLIRKIFTHTALKYDL